MTKVMLNPSCQYKNQVFDEGGNEIYNEGENLFDFARKVRDLLSKEPGFDVFISREGRSTPSSLDAEIELTNRLECDLLVSLHSDAAPGKPELGGTWTFAREEDFPLAQCVQSAVLEAVRSVYPEADDRGVREHWHRLRVLWETNCPACLTEILFHSNPIEREILKKEDFQWVVARGFAKGILEYLRLRHQGQ